MILIIQDVANKSRKADECKIPTIAEARRTAEKINLETGLLTKPKQGEAQSRKAEGHPGEPGFPGMLKSLIPTGVIESTGKITTPLRMQEPTTRKRGRKPEA
jgi:hypothetical protein